MLLNQVAEGCFSAIAASFNSAVNTDTLRDKAAQRRLLLR